MDFLTESGEPVSPFAGALLACDTLDECVRALDAFDVPADKRKGCIMDLCVHRMEVTSDEFASLLARHQSLLGACASVRDLLLSLSRSDVGFVLGSSCEVVDTAVDYD